MVDVNGPGSHKMSLNTGFILLIFPVTIVATSDLIT